MFGLMPVTFCSAAPFPVAAKGLFRVISGTPLVIALVTVSLPEKGPPTSDWAIDP